MDEALEHCTRGASTWKSATNDDGGEPDVVMACAGDVPTIETCAAAWLLQNHVPGIKGRVVDVVDLTALMMPDSHPHGMDNMSFNALFTEQAPVMFAFHNNRWSLPVKSRAVSRRPDRLSAERPQAMVIRIRLIGCRRRFRPEPENQTQAKVYGELAIRRNAAMPPLSRERIRQQRQPWPRLATWSARQPSLVGPPAHGHLAAGASRAEGQSGEACEILPMTLGLNGWKVTRRFPPQVGLRRPHSRKVLQHY
jgi:hypothetical protein